MKDFIHRIWCGDVQPGKEITANSAEIAELMRYRSRHKEKLLSLLDAEQKKVFHDYESSEQELSWLTQEDAFTEGVRYTVRFLMEAMG
ncbi:MAG: hypothetical protein IJX14_00645 [Clostridia bacterium]|nr:hypothetical protein [Clostridia bacterium]